MEEDRNPDKVNIAATIGVTQAIENTPTTTQGEVQNHWRILNENPCNSPTTTFIQDEEQSQINQDFSN